MALLHKDLKIDKFKFDPEELAEVGWFDCNNVAKMEKFLLKPNRKEVFNKALVYIKEKEN